MFLFLTLSRSVIKETIVNSRGITVDMSSDSSYEAEILQTGAIVMIHTINGFNAKAFDYQNNEIATFNDKQQSVEIGVWGGKIKVEKTGTNNVFSFSVFFMSALPIDMKCEDIQASNSATKELKMTASTKVSCLWLASPKNMSIEVKSDAKGKVRIYGPTSYSPIEAIEDNGSASITVSNVIIVLKPSSASGSVTAKAVGENIENMNSFNYLITPTGNASVSKTGDLPKPDSGSGGGSSGGGGGDTGGSGGDSESGDAGKPSGKSGNTGLIVALVIISIVFVVSACAAVFFYLKSRSHEETALKDELLDSA